MTLKSIRKLQLISVILHGVAFIFSIIILLFRKPFISLYFSNSELHKVQVFPWPTIAPLFVSLLAAILFLVLCGSLKTAKGSRSSVIVLLIVLYVFRYLIIPFVSTVYQFAISSYNQDYIAADSLLSSAVSLFASPLAFAGSVLMLLAMGGFYGYGRLQPGGHGMMTVKGIRTLQVIAVILLAVSLLLCIVLTVSQDTIKKAQTIDTDVIRSRVIPWDIPINLILTSVPAVFCLVNIRKGKRITRGIAVTAAVLCGIVELICYFLPSIASRLYGQFCSVTVLAAYIILSSTASRFLTPLIGAADMLIIFSLGGLFSNTHTDEQIQAAP